MNALLPGATVGILGGGQLGMMIAMKARRMGYRVAVLDPNPRCSARPYADEFVQGHFSDASAAVALALVSDVVTLETEHVPADALDAVAEVAPVHPAPRVLRTVQDRLSQKEFLVARGLPTAPFAAVHDDASLASALAAVGAPAVLKTRRGGYDGRGQAIVRSAEDAAEAWATLGRRPCILEAFVPFEREVSVVLARDADGAIASFGVVENEHRRGVLHTTVAPARVGDTVRRVAEEVAARVAEGLGHRGAMAVEMFVVGDGSVLVNEIAPRVHNSGHHTLGGSATSQFEQHLRAVLGHRLGASDLLRPAAMLNLLGDLWIDGPPPLDVVLAEPRARLHLYAKTPRAGRKVGHVLVLHDSPQAALEVAERLYAALAAPRAAQPTDSARA